MDHELLEHLMVTSEPSVRVWLFSMMDVLSHDELTKMTVTLWAVWYARRKLIHKGINQSPYATHNFVVNFIAELEQLAPQPEAQTTARAQPDRTNRWIPPSRGCVKINVDAGVSADQSVGTAAAVCRDRDGTFLGSSMLMIQGLVDPPTLEAIACSEGLALAQDLGMEYIEVASNCKQVIQHIQQGAGGDYGAIIKEILRTSSTFTSCNFCFEFRVSNFEPHKLARFGVSLPVGRHL